MHIPPADHSLFLRCWTLQEKIRQAKRGVDTLTATPLYKMRSMLDQPLPEEVRQKIECLVSRVGEESACLNTMLGELDDLSAEAEEAAQRIQNDNLRRFVKLYCLDGLTYTEAADHCGCSRRNAYRYAAILRSVPDESP